MRLSSFIRQDTALVRRRDRIVPCREHQLATSPTAETMRSDRIQSEFESPVAYQNSEGA